MVTEVMPLQCGAGSEGQALVRKTTRKSRAGGGRSASKPEATGSAEQEVGAPETKASGSLKQTAAPAGNTERERREAKSGSSDVAPDPSGNTEAPERHDDESRAAAGDDTLAAAVADGAIAAPDPDHVTTENVIPEPKSDPAMPASAETDATASAGFPPAAGAPQADGLEEGSHPDSPEELPGSDTPPAADSPEAKGDGAPHETLPDAAADNEGDAPTGAAPDVGAASGSGQPGPAEESEAEQQAPVAALDPASADASPASKTGAESTRPGSPSAPQSPPARSSTGFFPMLIGGVVAGGIGFGAHYLLPQERDEADPTAALSADLASLRAEIAALPPAPDLAPLEAEIAALRDQDAPAPEINLAEIESELAALRIAIGSVDATDLAPIEAQLAQLAAQGEEALATQERELAALRDALSASASRMAALGDEMVELRDLAERRIAVAEAAADMALARAGLETLRAALVTGAPYSQAVTQLREAGVIVPEVLAAGASSGIPTLEMLQESFPAAARAALRDVLQTAPTESTADRLGNFFRAQLGARSTVPRDGDDPDAVLSRAAAAVETADLRAALDELAALPDSATDGLGGWIAEAEARLAAELALPELIAKITTE